MLDILKVVSKAVGKSGGTFSHLCIDNGTVEANNGRISIVAQVPDLEGITATVPADKFINAVKACKGTPEVKTTDATLMVKSGAFSARIPLNHGDFPRMSYDEGEVTSLPPGVVDKLAIAQSFATSPAFNGVLLRNERICGVAESGAIAIAGASVPHDIVIPIDTVADIVSIKDQPSAIRVSDNYAVIEYASFKLRTALVDKKWPDLDKFLSFDASALSPITDELRDAVSTVIPFTDKNKEVAFTGDAVTGGDAVVDGIAMPESVFNGEWLSTAMKHTNRMHITDAHIAQFAGDGIVAVLAGKARKGA